MINIYYVIIGGFFLGWFCYEWGFKIGKKKARPTHAYLNTIYTNGFQDGTAHLLAEQEFAAILNTNPGASIEGGVAAKKKVAKKVAKKVSKKSKK